PSVADRRRRARQSARSGRSRRSSPAPSQRWRARASAADGTAEAVACRGAADDWRLEIVGFAARPADGSEVYVPATRAASEAVERAIDQLSDGEPLTPDAERELIGNGWAGLR